MLIPPGARFGRYEILSLLGIGGMGEVHLARDTELNRTVALKFLPADQDERSLKRFIFEAKAASALNHPNILTIHEIARSGDAHFIATEFIEGETLRARMRRARLTLDEALDIALQIATALAAAHGAKIVHRDIKPENIMIRRDAIVKVLDFGLAKLTESNESDAAGTAIETLVRTAPGVVMGTAHYMSPEQTRGQDVDARSDIWSFGVVLYEMIAGEPPFRGETTSDCIAAILTAEPEPLSSRVRDLPTGLQQVIGQTLRKAREERYQTIGALQADLIAVRREVARNPEADRSTTATSATPARTRHDAASRSSAENMVGELRRHKVRVALVLATLLGVVAAVARFAGLADRNKDVSSLAVLPFVNVNQNPDAEYLSDGISEGLINSLSHVPRLNVIAHSSSMKFKGKAVEPHEVARTLGVQAIVTGRVVQRGDRLQISAELIDARNDTHLWGEQYERQASGLLQVQGEISREIAGRLRANMTTVEQLQLAKSTTTNPEAYEWLLKGRYSFRKTSPEGTRKAVEYYKQAIEVDPNYALAHAELAYIYSTWRELFDQKEIVPRARAAAMKALALDDRLPEGHQALARIMRNAWEWAGAEREYTRALELNPNHVEVHLDYASFLSALGRHQQAIAEGQRARELDPLHPFTTINLGQVFYFARQYDRAIDFLKTQLELDPTSHLAFFYLGPVYAAKREYPEAVAAARQALAFGGDTASECYLGYVLGMAGRRGEARAIRDRLENSSQSTGFADLAVLYLGLGDQGQVLRLLDKAYAAHDSELQYLNSAPYYDSVRADPRFQNLVRRVGLTP